MADKDRRQRIKLKIVTDPVKAAKAADLRYVNDGEPGISRKHRDEGFAYFGADGKRIRSRKVIGRIEALVIPPAWTDVWICAHADGHIQATGRDDRGRKQYRYHERWREARDQTKFDRMILFGEALPKIRQQVEKDMRRHGLPREKVLAAVVALLDATYIRIGNPEYARQNDSFGLTTMRDEHATIRGEKIHFEFRGKSGKEHAVDLRDKRLAKIVKRSQDVPGEALFQFTDEEGNSHAITSSDVNNYLREISGQEFTAKDFRTWGGTTLAIEALRAAEPFESETQCKKNIVHMYKSVAQKLGNTVAVCRKYYVNPIVVDVYQQGTLLSVAEKLSGQIEQAHTMGLEPREAVIMVLLRERLAAA